MPALGSNTRPHPPLPQLEDLWARFDAVFNSLTSADWGRRHGKDWIVGDLPWHLYYFDRDLVLAALSRGQSVPSHVLADVPQTLGQLNAWNAREFAARPADETPQRSLARWREVRELLRDALVKLEPGGLDDPVFVPLMGAGWISARAALAANIGHHWNHFTQLRLYLRRSGPLESPVVRHTGLSFYMSFFQLMARAGSVTAPFTFTLDFTGPGGGPFTFRLADGCCTLSEEHAGTADLVLTQAPETFVKTFAHMHNPMLAMLTGQVNVRGLRSMGTFARLMPPENDELSLPVNFDEPVHSGAAAR
jgi:hypothetical protein